MSIIISERGKNAKRVDKSEIKQEDYLQNYIHENPESIPVYEIEEDKKLFVVAREFSTESGPIDALAIDKDGDIYVVETKLYKNPDKRTVVAQALDYGASLWRHRNYEEFIGEINKEINNKFEISFEEKFKEFFNLDDDQTTNALDTIKTNLQHGNIKFVVLMDSIDERLKDLILYVNQNSQFDIYAVQLEYYKFEQYEIMIPKLFGVEVKKSVGISTRSGRTWDESSFFNEAGKILDDSNVRKIKSLYDFATEKGEVTWGKGISPTFSMRLKNSKLQKGIFTLFAKGRSWVSVGNVAESFGNKTASMLTNELKKIGIEIHEGKDLKHTFPEFNITKLSNDQIQTLKKIIVPLIKNNSDVHN